MEVDIDNIIIKKRVRKNLGDLTQLMDSLRHHGLLNPIIITEKYELLAGHRRLEAARTLGWRRIEARVFEQKTSAEKLEIELNENLFRRDFTEDELASGFTRLDRLKNPSFLQRLIRRIIAFFRRLFRL